MSLSKKKIAPWSAAAFGALVLVAACGAEESTPVAAEQAATVTVTETEVVTETEAAPTPEVETETTPAKPAPKPKPELTVAQENAIESAQSYLDFSGFSRKSLIDQLVYEGFSKEAAQPSPSIGSSRTGGRRPSSPPSPTWSSPASPVPA